MLLRNTLWSLLGEGLPLAAAVISIPLLIAAVGMERFGALTLIWALLGYLGLLDMGLVRSMVQIVSERLGRAADMTAEDGPGRVAVPALALIVGLGIVAGAALALFAGTAARALTVSDPALADETRRALLAAALIVPTALASSGLRGLLEAHQRFRAVNLVRMLVGVLNYLSPLAVLPFYDGLVPVLAAILAGRLLGLALLAAACRRFVDLRGWRAGLNAAALRPLFAMGAWMTLNNLVGPAMMYADRFILGGVAAAAAIAYYTTPFEMATRLLFIPTAVAGVLFPLVARRFRSRPETVAAVLGLGGGGLLALFAVGVAAVALLGEWLLQLWLGADFARNSAPVLTVLMLGVALNAAAYVPYAVLHGVGRVDVTARLQLAELPVYLLTVYWLAQNFGPLGAAAAWSLRTGADLFCLLFFVRRFAPGTAATVAALAVAAALSAGSAVMGAWLGALSGDRLGLAVLTIGQIAAAAAAAAVALTARRRIASE